MSRPFPQIELERFVSYRMAVVSGRWAAATERFYRERFGLVLREWRVLAVMSRASRVQGMMPGEIARLTAVDKAGVSRALAALERRGLIERSASGRDARRSHVRLTARGRVLLRRLAPAALRRQARLAGALDPSERATFFRLLDKLELRIAEMSAVKRPAIRVTRR